MKPDPGDKRWQRVDELFTAALKQEGAERDAFIAESCQGDEALRQEIESLLKAHNEATGFMQSAVFNEAVELIAAPNAADDLASARMAMEFGDYELLEEVGRGGQGVVYRARQKSLNRTVALKVIALGHWASTPDLKRFRHEAEAAARLEHPRIVPIYEIGESEGSCYFSMQFVEGGQLDQVVRRGPMPIRRAAELLVKIARTVQFAHEHGILHRDIKPGNILLDKEGEPHLTDFGLARLMEQDSTITKSLDVLGTPSYMAPEQAAGHTKDLTAAADVYALGAVFYQMLTGQPPLAGGTTYETIRMVLETQPRTPRLWNPKVDRDLSTICLKCLEKDPQRRYASALALAEDVERWLRREPIQARRTGIFVRGKKWLQRNPIAAFLVVSLAGLAAAVGVIIWKGELFRPPPTTGIAVLPFENRSDDKQNAFFADGVQDEILTDLAKVADLKVISRTSVMQYKSATERNLRDIAKALGVAHVVEGTVQRAGDRVRVSAQLIDARTDTHLWAEHYDRELADIFDIQSEIAEKIVAQLKAKLSPNEKAAIEERPTADLAAYDLYLRAKTLVDATGFDARGKEHLLEATRLLENAVARDKTFLRAYYQLAHAHDLIYFAGLDHTPARLASAEAAIQAAQRLRPDSGEAHLALALHLYWGYRQYDRALQELAIARRALPNEPLALVLAGLIDRRQARWEQSIQELERALELDPRNLFILQQMSFSYDYLRRYADRAAVLDRVLAIAPKDVNTRVQRAVVDLEWRADTRPLHSVIQTIVGEDPKAAAAVSDIWIWLAWCERDKAAAERALAVLPPEGFLIQSVVFPTAWCEGLIYRAIGDNVAAWAAFTRARSDVAQIVRDQPAYAQELSVLGLIDAALGKKEEAIREGRRAVELLPVTQDSITGALLVEHLAVIYAWTGEKDLALEQLSRAARIPGDLSYGDLRLHPYWDPLRGEPRFEKIVASLAPDEKKP